MNKLFFVSWCVAMLGVVLWHDGDPVVHAQDTDEIVLLRERVGTAENRLDLVASRMRRNKHALDRISCSIILVQMRSEKHLDNYGTDDIEPVEGETIEDRVTRLDQNHKRRMYRLKLSEEAQNETCRRLHYNINWILANWEVGGPDYPGDK